MGDGGSWGGLFDEEVHLLADVEGMRGVEGERVEDLEDAGVHAFGAGASEVALGDDVGLDAKEGEGNGAVGVAFEVADGRGAGADAGGELFVHVGAELELVDGTDEDGRGGGGWGGVFAAAGIDLENRAGGGGAEGEAFEEGLGLGEVGAGGGDAGFLDGEFVEAGVGLVGGYGAGGAERFGAGGLAAGGGELGFLDAEFGFEGGEFGAEFAVVELEEGGVEWIWGNLS